MFCWAGRPSPRNRRDGVLSYFNMSYFNIVVTFYLIIYLSKSYLPPACSAIFGAGRRPSRWGGVGAAARPCHSVPPYFIVVVLFTCLFFIYIALSAPASQPRSQQIPGRDARSSPRNRRGSVPSYFIVVAVFCWAARPSPQIIF